MGGGKTQIQNVPTPEPVRVGESSRDVFNAQLEFLPKAAQLGYDILTNPSYGVGPTTRALEQTRQDVFPGETGVRDQLLSNVLANLISPTGISPQQQTAIDTRRGQAREDLTQAVRNRANLGGGLFGGRAATSEIKDLSNLENIFAEEDINREERARLNAIQAALPALQILFPDVGITAPQFQSPVPGADTAFSGNIGQRGQDINLSLANQQAQIQQAQQRAALQSALFGALGTAAGGFTGGTAFNNLLTR